ncbi:MAG: hypothetical protein IT373_11950 [Polyangiaceae bacterium]|nr:hypothetical protein [Polyangiaceae bacterium]
MLTKEETKVADALGVPHEKVEAERAREALGGAAGAVQIRTAKGLVTLTAEDVALARRVGVSLEALAAERALEAPPAVAENAAADPPSVGYKKVYVPVPGGQRIQVGGRAQQQHTKIGHAAQLAPARSGA